ncbi:LysM peptidoglycan-binding domain-containing protein [Mesorhizobium sp. LjNodule214]|uniref:LysM peptidoglycan-binding domain-containing protein n=1 Tax=Mesorhizobium sp. LjNodule214 TaxID=3342252 RepID=UPI003ECFB50F
MVRPITLTKPPVQPQKVNASANAAQVARLEAQAAQLREQIRLANRMGERDWAAQARQQLAQVNTELSSLQPPPVAPPGVNVTNASNGTSGNGTTVVPALYVRPDLAAPTLTPVKLDGSKPEDNAAEATTARNIVNDVTGGKSIDQIASARGMTREQVIAALRSGGMSVSTTDPTGGNGDVQTTKITDANGRTVTQYYDYQHDSYYTSVQQQPNGATTTTPVRDGLGRKETSSYNSDTGAITTRYEDDLGTGTVTERTSLPNGASVETVTPGAGPSLPVTTVTGPDGRKTILAAAQDPGGTSTQNIKDALAEGKSIEQIAQENGLTSEQVIAELQAAGYQVKTQEPTSDNGDVQSVEIVDPHSGDKTVYSHDYQHDARTVVTTADGKETSHSVDGNGKTRSSVRDTKTGETTTTIVDPKAGTETKIVTDKDGRVTTTTAEKINGGKPVEYEVKPGDNLTLIAEQHGVTLDDLRRTNPELFSSPRDPDIIHPGEKITIENGTRTTVEVTFNGYTLTTRPDGSATLHNNTTGTDLEIKAGSTQEALARTLLAVNPNSSDPKEAKEGEVVKTFVEGLLAGEALPSLIDAAEKAGQDKLDLIAKYGPGTVIEPKLDGENRVVDPFGDPPQGNAPSGGKWTPMKVDGVWTWVDPQVAQAIITENIALSRITETRALAGQRQEQFNVHMLDPAYKDAVDGAQTIINEALAPHGLQWTAQKPKGTLADAQERLTKANTLLQNAQDARGEYENAGRVLADAIAQQSDLTPLIDPNADVVSAQGQPGPNRETQYAQGLADHAAVDKLFSEVGLHLSKGDKLTIDFLVGQAELNGVPTDSKEYKDLKALQTTAGSQLELAQAYQDYFDAHANATQVGAQQTDLEQRLLAEYNNEHQFLFEQGKKHQRVSGDYLGLFQSQRLEIRDGQLWVVNQFEEGTTEQQLTYNLSEKNVRDEYRDRQLNKDWQQLLSGANSSGPVCTANGLGAAKAGEEQAAKTLNDVLDKQLGNSISDLNSKLTTLQTNFNNALTEHGPGTVDAPAGTLPDGVQPVEINVGGQTIKVAPEVAQKYNQTGIDALTEGGKAVWIDLDTKDDDASGRWVDPELAVAKLKLDATRLQITQAEDLRRVVQGFSDYHELRLSDPSLLADRNSTVDKTYLDEHEQQTLDGIYQPKFQQLLDSGYDDEFQEQRGTDLEETVSKKLGVNSSTEEGREAIENVTEEIRDIGGDNPYVRSVPIFYVDDEVGTQQAVLFAVRDGDGNTRYVDVTGKKFDDLGDFQDNNNQFGENGKLVVPKGLEMKAGDDGKVALEVVKARNVSVWDKVVDPLVGIGTGIATILSFTPAAPVAAPLAYTGAAYLGTRAVINQVNHLEHGGEWDDTESLMNVASVATTVLPMASSGLRTIGMAGREMTAAGLAGNQMTRLQAFRGSIGATRSGSPLALETRTYMQSTAGLNKVAWATDVGSVIVGAPLLATSAYDLAVNGDQMNGLQLANALTGLGTGITGTGLGIHGLRTLRPGTGTQASSNGPGANPPPGSGGPHQQPPGGKGPWPSQPALGPGPSGRPMNVHEMGADGVYRPTGEQVFHDPSHPVIQGEVIKTDDASGDGSTMLPGHDPHGSTPPGTPHPADGDPIIVPGEPTGKDGSVHLVWDPETRSFTGMPEPDTSGYVYTSGKDVTPPPHYRDTDPGDKPLSLEQLAARYQKEKEYYSSRELDQRYGDARPVLEALSETKPPESADGKPAKRNRFGDFRVSALGRVRINTEPLNAVLDLIPGARQVDLGSPTWRSYMVGIGRQTNFRAIGQAVSDGVKYKSAEPLRGTLGEELGISIRPNEHRNITAAQLKLWPAQRQIAFQYKGADLLEAGHQGLFGEAADSAFVVVPRSARLAGPTAEGANVKGWGVDLTFSLALRARPATLKDGERDFLHVPADGRNKFMQFEGDVPYKKVYQEDKYYLPSFIGVEQRYEVAMNATVPKDTVVVSQFVDENQGVLSRLRLRAHFVVKDEGVAKDLVDNPDVSTIRDLVESGQIDPDKSIFYVPGSSSGMRQSAVPGLPLEETIVNYSGKRQRVWNAQSSRLEVILNEKFFDFLPSPDRILLRKLPAPFSHYTPSDGSIYFNLFGKREAVAATVDRTIALSAPALRIGVPGVPFLQLPFALRGEIRFFYRTQLPEAAPIVAKSDFVQRDFVTEGELPLRIAVPRWLHELDARAANGGGIAFPKGGRASLEKWLDEIETTATPRQKGEIAEFRETSLPLFEDETFIPAGATPALRTFLMGQAKPVEAPPPEFAYLVSQDLQAPLVHWYSEQGVTETQRQTWYVNRLGTLSGDGRPITFASASDAGATRTAGRQGDLNYLRDGSITVGGRAVDAAALRLPVASDAFLVIAEKADLPGVDQLVRDIESHPNYRRGQDVVLFVCGGGTRENSPDSFVPVSLARTVADRLGGRAQAVDGDVHIGETIALDGSAVVELPGLPVIDVTGGRSDQQPNYDAQRRYWLSDGGRDVRVDGVFDAASMAHGAKVDGRPVDNRSLGGPTPTNKGQSAPNNGLTRDGVRATPLDQVPDLVMGDFQPNQIPWLKREQVAELTEQQFRDMDQADLLPYLTKSQLRGIPKARIGQVNIAGLDGKQIPWLTEGHIRNVTDQQFRDLGKAGLTPHLTKPQLQAMKGDMVELVDVSKLEARQVPWFKPGQVAKFTSQQFKDLGEAGLLKNLTERQVQAIPETMIDAVDVAKLDPKQVPWLTEKQIPMLTRDQWGAFTIHHTEALTQPQIEAVTPKQFEEMSPGQFRKFTLEQFEWMSGDHTNALSVLQLTTYQATHKKAMTPDQATSVDLALSHARMRENAQALATFGGMSTTSYMLWSSLPPTWTATAGAVAFGVRGMVFGAQALFPNATASHKPFGRFLNALGGATFIAAAPGAATGMIQGKDLVVNSTFTLGNIVYGTKSMLQSFTGRPVIRNLAEHLAGPGYVLGCAVYTLHSWPAPIATVAGTMFTFGCAEFWASAIRTDRMNRRSVPRTDDDIAAAEKSDKKWTAWDRWTLGITFGVGMLLFSLDALLAEPWEGAKTTPPPDPKKPDGDASSQQPDDPSDVPGEPQTPPETFPQLVVLADDGLNLRTQPDGDSAVVTVLEPGTFVEQTAKPSTDPSGEAWIPVEGFGPDGDMHSGWVSGDHVEVHPAGSSNPEGRTNPTLEKDGYQWVEVKNGDSIRLIARTHSTDVAETVVLNMDHILSPDMIFSGDRIYLPVTSVG